MPAGLQGPSASSANPEEADRAAAISSEASPSHVDADIALDDSAVLIRKFGSGLRGEFSHSDLRTMLTRWIQQGVNVCRRHLEQDQAQKTQPSGTNVERGLFALLSALVIISCAGAAAALIQVKSLKSEVASLQRDLLPLKERVAKLDQVEWTKDIPDKTSDDKIPSPKENRSEEAPLLLSREEIQLIHGYIKPAPVAGSSTAAINVGDPVDGPMIPFPSPVTEQVPKLLGARFAIRNGEIIIAKKDSRRADAVLGPNNMP
jgi:hypothetical protein